MSLDERPKDGDHSAVTVLVSRHVRPGGSAAFTTATQGLLLAARDFPGYRGGQLIPPPDDQLGGPAHVVMAFEGETSLAAWHNSKNASGVSRHWVLMC
jgi:antibiotic biosynthesis monooxygenase (ABM) superfamily enzyme